MIKIKIDSNKVQEGDIFVAIKGHTRDGHEFIDKAVDNGARAIVVSKDVKSYPGVSRIKVDDTQEWLDDVMVNDFSEFVNDLDLIGITGTNGKTTTAYLTYQLLNELGEKCAYIGTIGYYLPGCDPVLLPNTTPNILDLYDLLLTAKCCDCKSVAMEVSSQGMDMGRCKGLKFGRGLFTNLTQDHLDYHKTMDAYLECKLKLVDQLKEDAPMIVNADDEASLKFRKRANESISFGYDGDIKLINYTDTEVGTLINVIIDGASYDIETNLKGKFNVYNYLSVLSIVLSKGYEVKDIIEATKNIYPPKGRCEQIKVRNGHAVVDYAHTPDAVEKIINTFSENKKGRIITVVGCGGDRDPLKRPIMGSIATSLSDHVIFTDDNPRTEDNKLIMQNILAGVKDDNYEVIYDRKEAIEHALNLIQENDVVLILGKGHEDYQIIGKEKHHFDDKEVVEGYNLSHNDVKKLKLDNPQ